MRESSTHASIKLCVRITIQNSSLKALNSKNTNCVNTNLTTISHVAQCVLIIIKVALKSCRGIPSLTC